MTVEPDLQMDRLPLLGMAISSLSASRAGGYSNTVHSLSILGILNVNDSVIERRTVILPQIDCYIRDCQRE